jgi:probable rRNA maturation factor
MSRRRETARAVVIDIAMPCARWRRALPSVKTIATEAASAALAQSRKRLPNAELSLVLADDTAVAALNRRWRGRTGPTNVLSFSSDDAMASPGPRILGDVVLAYGTVAREAKVQQKTLADHLRHLVVHGVLHLLGYDHEAAGPARRMETLETRILAGLGVADPYRAAENARG